MPTGDPANSRTGSAGEHTRHVSMPTLDDLWEHLTWPVLLKAGKLAFRPTRLLLAFFYVVGIALLLLIADNIDGRDANVLKETLWGIPELVSGLISAALARQPRDVSDHLAAIFAGEPLRALDHSPWMFVLIFPLFLVWTALMGGAICRTAAFDHAHAVRSTWPEGMGFALTRWLSLLGALAIPLVVLWLLALALMVAGAALFNLPVLNILGGLFWFLFLLAGLAMAAICVGYLFAHPMLVPAVACDGADAFDAVQQAFAYVIARPLRLLLYIAILLIQAAAVVVLLYTLMHLAIEFARWTSSAWVSDDVARNVIQHREVLRGSGNPTWRRAAEESLSGTDAVAARLIRFWTQTLLLLAAAGVVSLYWCSATMLYLAMRRIADGQDTTELWMPGLIEGTRVREKGETIHRDPD